MGQKYAEYDDQRTVTAFYDSDLCDPPEGSQYVAISDADHVMLLDGGSKGGRMMIDEGGTPRVVASEADSRS
ncbi:hypothetical protein [Paraburkholderia susongensis]|uniref:Uncharacterized protein n=1 Tax=Paraburkholderia susongensis TaxID=1515439 RepID=A0A1X7I585_9BURK|nr:hypothetical protein [Paraburkholderia susongensis]SMG09226.1 hypothetical protein SAMN06265784_101312 [Paraburkholderia susongensis]